MTNQKYVCDDIWLWGPEANEEMEVVSMNLILPKARLVNFMQLLSNDKQLATEAMSSYLSQLLGHCDPKDSMYYGGIVKALARAAAEYQARKAKA